MKIKKVGSLCLKARQLCVWTGKRQCVGTPAVVYVMPETMPRINAANWAVLFGASEKVTAELRMLDKPESEIPINLDDYEQGEIDAQLAPLGIRERGVQMSCLISQNGIGYVNDDFLAPLMPLKEITFCERRTKGGAPYYIAREGMYPIAAIFPIIVKKDFIGQLEQLYELTLKRLIVAAATAVSAEKEEDTDEDEGEAATEEESEEAE